MRYALAPLLFVAALAACAEYVETETVETEIVEVDTPAAEEPAFPEFTRVEQVDTDDQAQLLLFLASW